MYIKFLFFHIILNVNNSPEIGHYRGKGISLSKKSVTFFNEEDGNSAHALNMHLTVTLFD